MNAPSLALLLFLAPPLVAQIDVPGDYPDPQSAVDAASPGDVIVIHGGTWSGTGGLPALTIDRAVTVIGAPAPRFVPPFNGFGQQPPAVRLVRPGSGTVVLENVVLGGQTNGAQFGSQSGGLVGGGFADVLVYDATITAPDWVALTGIGLGSSGIDLNVPFLLLSRCDVSASNTEDDGCYGFAAEGRAGVKSTGTVVVLDSSVVGGTHLNPCFPSPGCGPIPGGTGGPGVQATRVDEAGSTISGGPGASWSDSMGVPCGSASVGSAVRASRHITLANNLLVSSPAYVGTTVGLQWNTPGPLIELYYTRGVSAPYTLVPGFPDAYLRPGEVRRLGTFAAGGHWRGISLQVPPAAILIGTVFTFQGFNPPTTVTRPVSIVLGV
jgi:hypothetical protein